MTIRVVIVDDQPLMRQGFEMILEAQEDIDVVGQAADGMEALALVEDVAPDVVLMDIRMPTLDGIEATRLMPSARVLVLTTFGEDEYVVDALRAGASGFLLKDATPEELVHAVRVVARGDSLLAPAVTTRLIAKVLPALAPSDPKPQRSTPGGSAARGLVDLLTAREVDVLRLLANGSSNQEIALTLYISETTVKSHVSHVLAKLSVRDRVQAVVVAYEAGIVSPAGT